MRKTVTIQTDRDSEKKLRIASDPDFVSAPSYDNSLRKVRAAHPEGVPDSDIVKYLCLQSRAELEALHTVACQKLHEYLQS